MRGSCVLSAYCEQYRYSTSWWTACYELDSVFLICTLSLFILAVVNTLLPFDNLAVVSIRMVGVHSLWSQSTEIRSVYSCRTFWKWVLYGKASEEASRDSDLLHARWLLHRGKIGLLKRELVLMSTWFVEDSPVKTPANRLSRCQIALVRRYLASVPMKISIQTERKYPMTEGMYQLKFFQNYSINQFIFSLSHYRHVE